MTKLWRDQLKYQCRKCKRKLVGSQNVVLEVLNFRFGDGQPRVVTVIWCPEHAPKEEAHATLQG